ncbi:hypothetical protein PG988_002120 [Apiospora saccharicola]
MKAGGGAAAAAQGLGKTISSLSSTEPGSRSQPCTDADRAKWYSTISRQSRALVSAAFTSASSAGDQLA